LIKEWRIKSGNSRLESHHGLLEIAKIHYNTETYFPDGSGNKYKHFSGGTK